MIEFEEIQKYLPQYLSADGERQLYEDLKQFPDNIDSRIYTDSLVDKYSCFQGDGLNDLLVINLPSTEIKKIPCMVLSNTCDINPDNLRLVTMRVVYSPIFNLEKYKHHIEKTYVETRKKSQKSVDSHIESIKKQLVSHIFFLPRHGNLEYDSIVFFDRINNCSSELISTDHVKDKRIFTLSDYGFYIFLFKMSVHFTRIQEKVDRSKGITIQ